MSDRSPDRRPSPPVPRRWLITGGCGFIGSALIHRLTEAGGCSVRVLDDLSRGSLDQLPGGVERTVEPAQVDDTWSAEIEVAVAGVEDRQAAARCAVGADVVVHLAANAGVVQSLEDPHRDLEVNVLGTLNVLEGARSARAGRVVLASSAAAVGSAEPPVRETTLPRPSTPYGAGKLAGEAYASAYFQGFGLETVALRFGNVYGPHSGAKDSVVARFIKQWMDGETWQVFGDGGQSRDFIFIQDLLDAVLLAATVPDIGGRIFQIANSRETTINELAEALASAITGMGMTGPQVEHGPERLG
ncbi:MAG TPA: NAD-dependent epimerase/dehydratase family protein, partial [Longimicrobiales bacterium]|nr:NAD-dependent epimerase/dehydratase family protein [Longimicrobiales bacterium]